MASPSRDGLYTTRSSTVLGRWFDAGVVVPADLSREVIRGDEIGRLTKELSIAVATGSIPRRLGMEATRDDLIIDKRRARRVSHALRQALLGWAGSLPELTADEETWRLAAQIEWPKFLDEHLTAISNRARIVATWSIREGEERWGKSAIVLYENELSWIAYALRE